MHCNIPTKTIEANPLIISDLDRMGIELISKIQAINEKLGFNVAVNGSEISGDVISLHVEARPNKQSRPNIKLESGIILASPTLSASCSFNIEKGKIEQHGIDSAARYVINVVINLLMQA